MFTRSRQGTSKVLMRACARTAVAVVLTHCGLCHAVPNRDMSMTLSLSQRGLSLPRTDQGIFPITWAPKRANLQVVCGCLRRLRGGGSFGFRPPIHRHVEASWFPLHFPWLTEHKPASCSECPQTPVAPTTDLGPPAYHAAADHIQLHSMALSDTSDMWIPSPLKKHVDSLKNIRVT